MEELGRSGGFAVKGRDMEELGVMKETELLVGRQKMRNKKQSFLTACPPLKKPQEENVYSVRAKLEDLCGKTWY